MMIVISSSLLCSDFVNRQAFFNNCFNNCFEWLSQSDFEHDNLKTIGLFYFKVNIVLNIEFMFHLMCQNLWLNFVSFLA